MDTQPTAAVDAEDFRLASNTYGKTRVRLVKVERHGGRHDLKELTVHILFQGDFASCHETGDNSKILPTDTMKNTVYALAKQHELSSVEQFGQQLARHFLANNPQVSEARIDLTEHLWSRIVTGGRGQDAAFVQGSERRTSRVTATRERTITEAGIYDLVILKSKGSAFEGYIKDPYTTLKETRDRILATALNATWRYSSDDVSYNTYWQRIRETILDTFARHDSRSVQHTLYVIGQEVLAAFREVEEIEITMPNKHCLLVDLAPFGMENANEVFLPIDEPSGFIQGKVSRS
jgi:urate oxidase